MEDIILIDKPKGITSFDCIRLLRKELGVRKMGHAGTLDPQASGLMIIGIGAGTKKLNEYLKLPKSYLATITLGIETDTGDMEGKITRQIEIEPSKFSKEIVQSVLSEMTGILKLPVPIYSAIKKDGKPLYAYARKGLAVDIPVKEMEVTGVRLIGFEIPNIKVEYDVGSGTYIRSLAVELGRRLGVPAVLSDLRRTSIGEFRVEDARPAH